MSIQYSPRSAVAIAVLIQAVEHVRDFESDLLLDLASELKPDNAHFDETLQNIVDMRRRVVFANSFIISMKNVKVGEFVYFSVEGLEVIDKGLESLADTLAEEISEPFWKYEREMNKLEAINVTLTRDQFTKLRTDVEAAAERADMAVELMKEFRDIRRS